MCSVSRGEQVEMGHIFLFLFQLDRPSMQMTAASATACFNVQAKHLSVGTACDFVLYTTRIPYKVDKGQTVCSNTRDFKSQMHDSRVE